MTLISSKHLLQLTLVLLLVNHLASGQTMTDPVHHFQSVLHKPYSERAPQMDTLFRHIEGIRDTTEADHIIQLLKRLAQKADDREMIWEADLLAAYYKLMHTIPPGQQQISHMQELADRAEKQGLWYIQARAVQFISHIYWFRMDDYEKAFETYFKLRKIVSKMSPEEFPDMAYSYLVIGRAHFFFRNYRKAINIFRKAASLPKTEYNKYDITRAQNNIGLSYQKLNLLDSSDLFFNKIIRDSSVYASEVWKGIASGSLGYNYYLRKQYDEAEPLFHYDIKGALQRKNIEYAAVSLIPLADICIRQNRLQEAKEYILQATELIDSSGEHDRLRLLYPVISKWHTSMGNKIMASEYMDSTIHAIKEYNKKFSSLKLLRARQTINAREHQILKMQADKELQQRNILIAIVSLFFLSGLVFFWFRNKYLLRKQEIKELALKNARKSLEHAQEQLNNLSRRIREKNKLIEQLKQTVGQKSDYAVLEDLKNSIILTPEDWKQFKILFRQAYPEFLKDLYSHYPNLTTGELRYLCLEKLDLSNYEMASVQGISADSIRVTKYRIRKKLGLTNQEELKQAIRGL